MKSFLLSFLLVILCFRTFGQDLQLANSYYLKGEFDKALPYFQKLDKSEINETTENRYVDCLIRTGNSKEAEKRVSKQVKNFPTDYRSQVLLGQILEKEGKKDDADKHYKEVIDELQPSVTLVTNLYTAFKDQSLNNWALETLQKGRKMLKNNYPLNFQFAEIYGITGETEKMYEEFLSLIDFNPSYKYSIENILERYLHLEEGETSDYTILQSKLIERIQKKPNEEVYPEMLIWLYLLKKDFASALTQAKALDKRFKEAGKRVYELGMMATSARAYTDAKKCFQYVCGLGQDQLYFNYAEAQMLHVMFLEVTDNKSFQAIDLQQTEDAYLKTITRLGNNRSAYPLLLEYAEILGFYAGKPDEAKKTVDNALEIAGVSPIDIARGKILLGDIDVLTNDIWDASLLYMQVESDFKYEPIGAEGKFKNARIFYFDGEFEWAQGQLDVLKASTSKLIANDAMKLSLLITDNLGLDSNLTAMRQFAKGDLLLEQHQYQKAFELYDSILTYFPFHGLADEVLMRKAQAMQQQGKWNDAIPLLEKVVSQYGEDILADDAAFQLAKIYDNHLIDSEKAKEWYRKILFSYPGSLHVAEARTRFRELSNGNNTENLP